MTKNIINVILLMCGFVCIAQQNIQEEVYVHLSAQSFLSGETLYFSGYCRSQLTGEISKASKILYVEIVGEKGPVSQQKITLEDGRGYGEFFISSVIPSGQYYLLAYTRWMKNFGQYFKAPMTIINPYESYQNPLLARAPKISFYGLSNSLVVDENNLIAYHLQAENPENFKGRLVTSNGEEVAMLNFDEIGIGKLEFTLRDTSGYQAILTDENGNLSFHEFVLSDRNQSITQIRAAGSEVVVTMENNLKTLHFNSEKVIRENIQYSYQLRERTQMEIKVPEGNYSVSVRRLTDDRLDYHTHAIYNTGSIISGPVIPERYFYNPSADLQAYLMVSRLQPFMKDPEYVQWLPEVREEILTGSLRDSAGNSIANQLLALSFPGDPYQIRIGKTNEAGRFNIPFQSSTYDHEALITPIEYYEKTNVEVESPFLKKLPNLQFDQPFLDSALVARLLERCVRNQIENAFYQPAKIAGTNEHWTDQIVPDDLYFLDAYERFPTLKETFTEFIVTANIRERRDYVIQSTYTPGLGKKSQPPLVLLDGIPLNGADVVSVNPILVESVGVTLNRVFLGALTVDGVVDIRTKEQNISGLSLPEYVHELEVSGLSLPTPYQEPEWVKSPETTIPDQREQLLWKENLSGEILKLDFVTSDVPGYYELVIEGFTVEGKPYSLVKIFNVSESDVQ